MLRVLGIPALLVAVVVALYASSQAMKSNGTAAQSGQPAITQAPSAAAGANFSQVVSALQAFYGQNQPYVGATLPAGSGVVLARADATSYCQQTGDEHEDGPGGQPAPGPC